MAILFPLAPLVMLLQPRLSLLIFPAPLTPTHALFRNHIPDPLSETALAELSAHTLGDAVLHRVDVLVARDFGVF